MAETKRAQELDTLVNRYLAADPESESGDTLGEAICSLITPTIRSIVTHKLGSSVETGQEIEDVCADVVLAMLGRLDDLRSQNTAFEGDFSAYAAVSSYNACNNFFRHRFPERERIKNRLRYLLKPARGLDLWQQEKHEWLCGRAGWRGASHDRRFVPRDCWSDDLWASPDHPLELLETIFDRAGGPVRFDDLVDVATELWAAPIRPAPDGVEPSSPGGEAEFGSTATIARIWREILELPCGQRQALLLNLRGWSGGCAISLFPLMGVASLPQIAAALEIPVEEFAELWNRLPLDDAVIAGRLGGSRQQVINLRKSARKRLERRMLQE